MHLQVRVRVRRLSAMPRGTKGPKKSILITLKIQKKTTKKTPQKTVGRTEAHEEVHLYIYIKTQMAQSIGGSPITYYCNKQHSKWSQNRVWTLHTLIRDMMTKVIWC